MLINSMSTLELTLIEVTAWDFGVGWLQDRASHTTVGVNGAAMRVSPLAFAFETLEEVLEEAKASAEVTHNHPEGIRGRKRQRRPYSWLGKARQRKPSATR
jgi:ADP-ribosylglycohydrolase